MLQDVKSALVNSILKAPEAGQIGLRGLHPGHLGAKDYRF